MPIVVRDGVQYQLEGPNDVPSSGNRIGPVPGIPPVGGFGQSAPFASTGTRRVDLPGGGYTLVPQSTYGDPSLYENSISKTAAAPSPIPSYRLEGPNDVPSSGNRIGPVPGIPVGGFGQGAPGPMGAPNLGSWAPTRPEYLTAPGYETYAPTRAYGYSPTGGNWSGGFGSGGGGGGGGLASGDFGGGTDNSTLGNALSALSLLGGANSLSSFLTGESLLEHAGFDGGLLGSGGSGTNAFGTPNPSTGNLLSNAMDLFGSNLSASADLGLPSLARALEISNATGGLGPTGELFSGLPNVNSFPGTQTFSGGTAPLQGNLGHLADFSDFAPSLEGLPSNLTPNMGMQPAPLNLNVPDPFNLGTGEYASNAYLSPPGTPTAGPYGPNPAFTEAALNTLVPGYSTTLGTAATAAGMSPGLTSAYMTGAIPEFGMGLGGAAAPAAGAAGTGAGGLASMGAAGALALAGIAYALMQARRAADPFDPTAETRRLNQIENMMQGGGGDHPLTQRYGAGIEGLEQLVYNDPYKTLDLLKDVTSGGNRADPFGTVRQSGATTPIAWSPNVSALVQENMHLLEAARAAGQAAEPSGEDDPAKPAQYVPARLYEPPPVWDYSSDPDGPPPSGRVLTGDEYYELHGGR